MAAAADQNRKMDFEEIQIPPGPRLGSLVVEVSGLAKGFDDRMLIENLSFTLPPNGIVGVIGPNGVGKTTLFKMIVGEEQPDAGSIKIGETVQIAYVDQSRERIDPDKNVWQAISDGETYIRAGRTEIPSRAYVAAFGFKGADQQKPAGILSGGERNRVNLALTLKQGGNLLLLDEPTNDLDLPTLRVLEEALIAFAGVVCVVSHDRYFLNRVCTDILAFEGDGKIHHSVGDYDYYLEKKRRGEEAPARRTKEPGPQKSALNSPREATTAPKPAKAPKLSFKEARELAGMEPQIHAAEAEVARIEALFAAPDFHRTHAAQTNDLVLELAVVKQNLAQLYARWEELEALKGATAKSAGPGRR
jgi:ABC-type multidrug transport system ATPase subunit